MPFRWNFRLDTGGLDWSDYTILQMEYGNPVKVLASFNMPVPGDEVPTASEVFVVSGPTSDSESHSLQIIWWQWQQLSSQRYSPPKTSIGIISSKGDRSQVGRAARGLGAVVENLLVGELAVFVYREL